MLLYIIRLAGSFAFTRYTKNDGPDQRYILNHWRPRSSSAFPTSCFAFSLRYSADGEFTVTILTKATLTHNGTVRPEPPPIYLSCNIFL